MAGDDTLERLRAGALAGARRVAIARGLEDFPREIFELADSLEILDLSGNALERLPTDLHRLHRLRVLFCSNNRFTELPPSLGGCARLEMVGFKANQIREVSAPSLPPQLRWLILTDNDIERLPDALGERPRLQKLMLAGNRLDRLPETLAGCERLELLRIAANRFDRLPPWLARLPRLAWLAFGGNPMCRAREDEARAASALPRIDAADLLLGEKLGEGASGVIHRALWRLGDRGASDGGGDRIGGERGESGERDESGRSDGESAREAGTSGTSLRPIAVKRFKGAMTSDGTPRSEMAACMAAGDHPGLIGALARIGAFDAAAANAAASDDQGHRSTDQAPGHGAAEALALRLVDPAFEVLAGPPSLESCTRDVYDGALRFTVAQAWRLAGDIAGAAAHLHARGILHGDLYAHNILWHREAAADRGTALLGDFGAASLPDAAGSVDAGALERIEVRAFGCLLEELTERCDVGGGGGDAGISSDADAGAGASGAADGADASRLAVLRELRVRCLQADPTARPGFSHLAATLRSPSGT